MAKNNSKITLSIIIPVYNEEEGISYAITEIYKDAKLKIVKDIVKEFEVIAVDDGSFDKTSQILQELKTQSSGAVSELLIGFW